MIWKIAKKEFLLSLMTFKFVIGAVVCIVLTGVFVPILARDYQQRLKTYHGNVAREESELRKVKVYRNIMPTVFRPPCLLSAFSEGLEKRVDDSAKVELEKVPVMRAAAAQRNPYQSIFPIFDASLIFRIVISILALLVAYDAISGERERGTLKLTLSGMVRRHEILLGKLLAGAMVLVVPVTLVFVIASILLLSFPMVSLTGSDWVRIGLMYFVSLVFTAAMYNTGLMLSCLVGRSAISLVLGLFLWILFVVVAPNGSVCLATQMHPLRPQEEIDAQLKALRQDFERELRAARPGSTGDMVQSDAGDAFGRWYHRSLNKDAMDYYSQSYRAQASLGVKYADKSWELERAGIDDLAEQKRLAGILSRVSPVCLYDSAMSRLAGTDIGSLESFTAAVQEYRSRVVDYIRAKTSDFSATSLFTPYTFEQMQTLRDGAEDPPLNLADFPGFQYEANVLQSLRRAIPDLGLLIFANLLFFALSFLAFMKYDVR